MTRPTASSPFSSARTTEPQAGKLSLSQSYKRLGEHLLAAGLITRFQLKMALQEQLSTRQRLGVIVAEKGWVPQDAVENIATQMTKFPNP
ncbi:MAG: hypothetical protein VKJ85_00270 [Prochlorothrix sp.]|nr:hypothetical protein [Prochlorothrix sp.]